MDFYIKKSMNRVTKLSAASSATKLSSLTKVLAFGVEIVLEIV